MTRKSAEVRRKRIAEKRGMKCEQCGYSGYLDLHHIRPYSQGGSCNDDNLIFLCEYCHAKAHGATKRKWIDPACAIWHGIKPNA